MESLKRANFRNGSGSIEERPIVNGNADGERLRRRNVIERIGKRVEGDSFDVSNHIDETVVLNHALSHYI
jgi:hypothetical protein